MPKTATLLSLFASATADITGTVYVTVPRDCDIVAFTYSAQVDSAVDNSGCTFILTHNNAALTNNVNDAKGTLQVIALYQNFTTSGLDLGVVHGSVQGIAYPVKAGDRLYLNADWTAGIASCNITLFCTS